MHTVEFLPLESSPWNEIKTAAININFILAVSCKNKSEDKISNQLATQYMMVFHLKSTAISVEYIYNGGVSGI